MEGEGLVGPGPGAGFEGGGEVTWLEGREGEPCCAEGVLPMMRCMCKDDSKE